MTDEPHPWTGPAPGLDAHDWGLLYGYGVFETMRVRAGVPCGLDLHLDRMVASAAALGIVAPARDDLAQRVLSFCAALRWRDRVVRVTLTAGNPDGDRGASVLLMDRPVPYAGADYADGIPIQIAAALRDERSALVPHKTLNQLANVLAWQSAVRDGFREAVFFNGLGYLAEGTRSNVFVVKDGRVVTPPVTAGILAGITRAAAIRLLRDAGVEVHETDVTHDALVACDECFLTNAVMGIMPVRCIGKTVLPAPVPGALTALVTARHARDARDEAAYRRQPMSGAGS